MRPRTRLRRGAGGAMSLSLMPFLDVVFATIGIFVLIFAVQVLARTPQPRQPVPFALVACTDAKGFVYFAAPDAPPERWERWRADALVGVIAERAKGVANVLFAVGADCIAPRRDFMEAFQAASARLSGDPEGARPLLRLTQWPLSSKPEAVATLVARWGGEP